VCAAAWNETHEEVGLVVEDSEKVRVGKGADGLKIGVLWAMRKVWGL
jgi:hypothetical protein